MEIREMIFIIISFATHIGAHMYAYVTHTSESNEVPNLWDSFRSKFKNSLVIDLGFKIVSIKVFFYRNWNFDLNFKWNMLNHNAINATVAD